MKERADFSPVAASKCEGGCKGCGKLHIKIMDTNPDTLQQLRANVAEALLVFPVDHKIIEVCEPASIAVAGVHNTPALLFDGQTIVQGRIPSATELIEIFRSRYLQRSKIHRLQTIAVAVDISQGSDSALCFAWHIAQKTGATLEVVYAMDSIFDGHTPAGFLSGYQHTMQLELDAFIRDSLAGIGVTYEPVAPGAPPSQKTAVCTAKVIYGFPETALEEHSKQVDLLILGTTGRGALGKKIFGSVSTEVSRHAHCPVLLIPPEAVFRGLQNIIYASNFDSLSTLRIQQAVSFAQHFDGQVHFVHVGPGGEKAAIVVREAFETIYQESQPERPFQFAKMVSDDVTGALYEYAFYHRVELMVFVTHQRSFWENILHHSITREVAASTDLPMLIIHSDDDMVV